MQTHRHTYPIDTVESSADLPGREWDEVAGENIFMKVGWLRTLEQTVIESLHPTYVLMRDTDRLLGGAVCYMQNRTDHLLGMDGPLWGRLKHIAPRLGLSFRPVLASPLGFASRCPMMVREGLTPQARRDILEALLEHMESQAHSRRVSLALSTTSEDPELNSVLLQRGYTQTMDIPLAYLDVEWEDFPGYLEHLRQTSRNIAKSIKKEIRKNRLAGVRMETPQHSDELDDTLMKLFRMNHSKYEDVPFKYHPSFLSELRNNLDGHVVIHVGIKDTKPVGACLTLALSDRIIPLLSGIDHGLSDGDLTYFNLNIYEQIRHALSSGAKRIYFGQGAYDLKIRRGCKLIDTYINFKPLGLRHRSLARLWLPLLSAWVKAKLPTQPCRNNPN